MRYFLPSLCIFFLSYTGVHAADQIASSEQEGINWDGIYVGAYVGTGLGHASVSDQNSVSDQGSASSVNTRLSGDSGGVLFGYNRSINQFLYGLEANLGIHEIKGKSTKATVTSHSIDNVMSASLKGRLGYMVGDYVPYVSLGLVNGRMKIHSMTSNNTIDAHDGPLRTKLGWTVGAGVDMKLADHLALRFDYAYENFGHDTFQLTNSTLSSDYDTHLLRAALLFGDFHAAKKIKENAKEKSKENSNPPKLTHSSRWDGPYMGFYRSFGFGHMKGEAGQNVPTSDLDGGSAGVVMGYGLTFDPIYVGVDAELALTNYQTSYIYDNEQLKTTIFWDSALRAKIGLPMNTQMGQWMPYVAGGLTIAQAKAENLSRGTLNLDPLNTINRVGIDEAGWVAALGLDYRMTEQMVARLEYRYNHFGLIEVDTGGPIHKTRYTRNSIVLGVNYQFQ